MKTAKLNPHIVLKIINQHAGRSVEKDLNTRKKEVVEPRQLAMYFLYSYTPLSMQAVGDIFNRNHATVLHAWRKVPDFIRFDKELRKLFVSIQTSIVKNIPAIHKYSSETRFETIAEDLYETKRLNGLLIHRAINIKSSIDLIPEHIKKQYFGHDKYIYPTK
jgi:hypothetical protein